MTQPFPWHVFIGGMFVGIGISFVCLATWAACVIAGRADDIAEHQAAIRTGAIMQQRLDDIQAGQL